MTLPPIRPSAALRDEYEKRLTAVVYTMHHDVVRRVSASYAVERPEVLYAIDASPARTMQNVIGKLGRKWLARFDEMADSMAAWFATAAKDRVDRTMRDALRIGGMSVRFRMSAAMRDAYEAVRADNVALIRSIASQYLTQVESLVMQSVAAGRDLGTLTTELVDRYGVTKRRAARIALHQNNLATTTMRQVRELELGIVEGTWLHSAGGKHPREPHVAFSGKRFPIARGHDFKDGNGLVMPGQLPGCRCTWKAVVPGFDD